MEGIFDLLLLGEKIIGSHVTSPMMDLRWLEWRVAKNISEQMIKLIPVCLILWFDFKLSKCFLEYLAVCHIYYPKTYFKLSLLFQQ